MKRDISQTGIGAGAASPPAAGARTTPEEDSRFIVEHAAAMEELSRLLTSGSSVTLVGLS